MILTHEWESLAEIQDRVAVDPVKLVKFLTEEFYARKLEIRIGSVGPDFGETLIRRTR